MTQEIKTMSNYELRDAIDRIQVLYKESNSANLQAIYLVHSKRLLAEQGLRAEARDEIKPTVPGDQ